ncbi:NADH-quinone oxidoreductase subunit G [Tsukamurella sp. 8F]|uniref:NADH-quinone oxidoreductase subunit G n=1 Tax=unclassified Tsukamurella TaxID=2633480 RepID=UPI0023B88A96|nr:MULTISPECIES: NADH-quinone oxidoreductase subunit G [unclassified Tsukamurella]MDF0530224.1 NADH-quinone oxidoreductase subunit G [Tsukamurella sp. 8J]MDF0586541.1 NADH-quinone oxidoreductase subunit G [Tsukamurella sp. 8F]
MTTTPEAPATVHATIDGTPIDVAPGTLVIRAAEELGIAIPRFCDHPLLPPAGACRQCLVDVEGQRKPLASCTTTVTDGMVVHTQFTSDAAAKAQRGVMELLLVNHPLDCPVCDKGGECPLQNQAMTTGRDRTRFPAADKRTYPKPIPLSAEIILDRERCVLCARCTRFSKDIAGDPFVELMDRGALQQVGVAGEPLDSYFSGNTVQICPVGALTSTAYRFRARPFDLTSTPSACEHCASGCALRVDHRRGAVLRRLAGDDPDVNEEWTCDKGRFAFVYGTSRERITTPLVRGADGELAEASWPEAVAAAAHGMARGATGVLPGGRGSVEDLYAYSAFARIALGTNDIDFRSRASAPEEESFLTTRVAGVRDVTYADVEGAPVVLLAGLEPEEESPILHLRLRKAVGKGTRVISVAPFASRGLGRLSGELLACPPGDEASALADPALARRLTPGSLILVGERLCEARGGLAAGAALADSTGARLAWIPRRAGDRGAVEAGALPGLLPGGRRADDGADVERFWGTVLPTLPGRDAAGILAAATRGEVHALLCGAVDVSDLPDPVATRHALDVAGFVVSLEQRRSEVTDRADVVLPVASVAEKAGTFLDWEGRERPFGAALPDPGALSDARVLSVLANAMGADLGFADVDSAQDALRRLGVRRSEPAAARGGQRARTDPAGPGQPGPAGSRPVAGAGQARLASWRQLLDLGRMQDGERQLAATARPPVARMSAATAAEIGAVEGSPVVVSTDHGAITLPLAVTDMPDRVVWVPRNSPGSSVFDHLAAATGDVVAIHYGGAS